MKLLTQSQVNGIIRSVKSVFVHDDIEKLTKPAYNFIMLSSGFIAHYDLYGFRMEYRDVYDLAKNLILNHDRNQWNNFRPGEQDYEYYMQKKRIYNQLVELASWYLSK
jgi:hypothetical protein